MFYGIIKVEVREMIIKVFCHNCKADIMAYKDEKGIMKYECHRCGAVNIAKPMSRRKIKIELIVASDQVII